MHVKSVHILGGGSAGFLTTLSLRKVNPRLPITVIRSRKIGIKQSGNSGGTDILVPASRFESPTSPGNPGPPNERRIDG
jgi:hypothetical protein